MGDLNYQRMVIAYHGCDKSVVTGVLLRGETLKASENEYDWLGRGIYSWEHGPQRAFQWAQWRMKNSREIKKPAVLGAYLQLGNCFDLLDTLNTKLLGELFPRYWRICEESGIRLPENRAARGENSGDLVLRYLDCAVVNWCLDFLERETHQHHHTVRCVFTEGEPAFAGSKIMVRSHIQIVVRDVSAIVGYFMGYFKPNIDNVNG